MLRNFRFYAALLVIFLWFVGAGYAQLIIGQGGVFFSAVGEIVVISPEAIIVESPSLKNDRGTFNIDDETKISELMVPKKDGVLLMGKAKEKRIDVKKLREGDLVKIIFDAKNKAITIQKNPILMIK
jgi:hypothetical protein